MSGTWSCQSTPPATTPISSPHSHPLDEDDNTIPELNQIAATVNAAAASAAKYNIPPSVLQRLTPVSPPRRTSCAKHGINAKRVLNEKTRKLRLHSHKVHKVIEEQRRMQERKRRYSNEALQSKLETAKQRRMKLNHVRSQRASESAKVIEKRTNDLTNALRVTKNMIKVDFDENTPTYTATHKSPLKRALVRYIARKKYIPTLLGSGLLNLDSDFRDVISSRSVQRAVTYVMIELFEVPTFNRSAPEVFLRSFNFTSFSDRLVTTLPKVKDKQPYAMIFDNAFYEEVVGVMIKLSQKLISSFKILLLSNTWNKIGFPYLCFNKNWLLYNKVHAIFLKMHAIRSLLTLNNSIEVLLRSKSMLSSKSHDSCYQKIKQDLMDDMKKYDHEIKRLRESAKSFENNAKMVTFQDIYYLGGILKANKRVHSGRDMFPTFVKSMHNWRCLIIAQEFDKDLQFKKETCNKLNTSHFKSNEEDMLATYEGFCDMLGLENYIETLTDDEDLTSFGIRLFDFLNNSMNNSRLMPYNVLSHENFEEFFIKAVHEGFEDILTPEKKREFQVLLTECCTEAGMLNAKAFLISLVKRSIALILEANLPRDCIAFEKYQFERKFDIFTVPLLFERLLARPDQHCLVIGEILKMAKDASYKPIETLQSFEIVVKTLVKQIDEIDDFDSLQRFLLTGVMDGKLYKKKTLLLKLKADFNRVCSIHNKCYSRKYDDVRQFITDNCM